MRGQGQGEQDYNGAEVSDPATDILPTCLFWTGSQVSPPSVFGWKIIGLRVIQIQGYGLVSYYPGGLASGKVLRVSGPVSTSQFLPNLTKQLSRLCEKMRGVKSSQAPSPSPEQMLQDGNPLPHFLGPRPPLLCPCGFCDQFWALTDALDFILLVLSSKGHLTFFFHLTYQRQCQKSYSMMKKDVSSTLQHVARGSVKEFLNL